MQRALLAVAILVGALPTGAAVAVLTGLGVLRGLASIQVGAAAATLTLLPVAGLWTLFGRSPTGFAAALLIWPSLLLAGLPGYFPGEVPGAMSTGFAVFAAAGGRDLAVKAAAMGQKVGDSTAAAPAGQAPLAEAEKAVPDCKPSAVPLAGDQVALPYEGSGHSMVVPVQFGETELPMLFDTGASLTTLNRKSLAALGVSVPSDAPEITLRTANGARTAKLVVVPKVWVGGLPVEGVTVGVCEECADDHSAGLLGLNVSSQFLVTVDTSRQEVVFQAREPGDRQIDIAPWLRVSARAAIYPDGRVEVEATGENAAPRRISEAVVGIGCGDDHFEARLRDIPAESVASTKVSLPRGTDCQTYQVTLDRARW